MAPGLVYQKPAAQGTLLAKLYAMFNPSAATPSAAPSTYAPAAAALPALTFQPVPVPAMPAATPAAGAAAGAAVLSNTPTEVLQRVPNSCKASTHRSCHVCLYVGGLVVRLHCLDYTMAKP